MTVKKGKARPMAWIETLVITEYQPFAGKVGRAIVSVLPPRSFSKGKRTCTECTKNRKCDIQQSIWDRFRELELFAPTTREVFCTEWEADRDG